MRKTILTAVVFLVNVALISAASKGVDISNYNGVVPTSTYQNFNNQGYKFAVVQAWQENHGNPDFQQNVNNAKSAGMNNVDAYAFVCNTCHGGTTPQEVVSNLKSTLPQGYDGRVWLDVEQCSGCWTSNGQENHQFVSNIASQLQNQGYNVGIYSNKNMWNEVMGSASSNTGLSNLPLWYAHYNNQPNFDDSQDYKFAGWNQPAYKQYAGDTTVNGQDVDLDYGSTAPASKGANTQAAANSQQSQAGSNNNSQAAISSSQAVSSQAKSSQAASSSQANSSQGSQTGSSSYPSSQSMSHSSQSQPTSQSSIPSSQSSGDASTTAGSESTASSQQIQSSSMEEDSFSSNQEEDASQSSVEEDNLSSDEEDSFSSNIEEEDNLSSDEEDSFSSNIEEEDNLSSEDSFSSNIEEEDNLSSDEEDSFSNSGEEDEFSSAEEDDFSSGGFEEEDNYSTSSYSPASSSYESYASSSDSYGTEEDYSYSTPSYSYSDNSYSTTPSYSNDQTFL